MIEKDTLIMTEQRRVILEELRNVHSHPTADDVFTMVRKRIPNISLGTVYRNLEVLSEAGLIQKLEMSGTQKRFDGVVENHYHVRCVRCNRVDDLHVDEIRGIEEIETEVQGYKILSHRLEFLGLCPRCRSEDPQEEEAYEVNGVRTGGLQIGEPRARAIGEDIDNSRDYSRTGKGGKLSNGGSEGFKN